MKGILNIFKPPNMTSHDIVSVVRRRFSIKRVGHTGTLDPMAVGVLPVCIGNATKVVDYIQEQPKTYRAEITLGISTDTQDRWGKVIDIRNIEVNKDEIIKSINDLVGEVEQIPPMYSALKHKGKKLYELAREGITVERKSRKINIYSIDIIKCELPKVIFDVKCSKGTYVRTLCHDIGEHLNCGAHMSFLARLQTGKFTINNTITIEELNNLSDSVVKDKYLYNIDYPLYNLPKINLDESYLQLVLNGGYIDLTEKDLGHGFNNDQKVLIYVNNLFLAIGTYQNNTQIKVKKLFS